MQSMISQPQQTLNAFYVEIPTLPERVKWIQDRLRDKKNLRNDDVECEFKGGGALLSRADKGVSFFLPPNAALPRVHTALAAELLTLLQLASGKAPRPPPRFKLGGELSRSVVALFNHVIADLDKPIHHNGAESTSGVMGTSNCSPYSALQWPACSYGSTPGGLGCADGGAAGRVGACPAHLSGRLRPCPRPREAVHAQQALRGHPQGSVHSGTVRRAGRSWCMRGHGVGRRSRSEQPCLSDTTAAPSSARRCASRLTERRTTGCACAPVPRRAAGGCSRASRSTARCLQR